MNFGNGLGGGSRDRWDQKRTGIGQGLQWCWELYGEGKGDGSYAHCPPTGDQINIPASSYRDGDGGWPLFILEGNGYGDGSR